MSKDQLQSNNDHIEDYLNYYCGLPHPPGFAVLLKGKWGCGKTWFIKQYCEQLNQDKKKSLYVSLYGISSFAEIENEFFRQLHPLLSSKGMAITGKIFQGLLKTSLKIDLNQDGNYDGSMSLQIPKLDLLPESFKNADERILIFDDLERCKIDISNILGYINYFVEHQNFKVILLANEDQLLDKDGYKSIKEKLIGKTFSVNRNLHAALSAYIEEIENEELEKFLFENIELIEKIYQTMKYDNLRSLKQIILDFKRIFQELSDKAKNSEELLQEILKVLIAFSIEIKRGNILSREICSLPEKYSLELKNQVEVKDFQNGFPKIEFNKSSTINNNKIDEAFKITKTIDICSSFNFNVLDPFLTLKWWQTFFDKGIIESYQLKEAILNSKYFQDENTPNWIKLWHFYDTDITDDEYKTLLSKVELEYADRKFVEEGEIKHITGLFLHLSDNELYFKSKQDLLKESKNYIDDLVVSQKLDLTLEFSNNLSSLYSPTGYKGLGYQGIELEEFKEFW